MDKLIKIDRNGTKYYEGQRPCPRCNGKGIYYIGVCNGNLVPSPVDQGVCFQCLGNGEITEKWKVYTEEYEKKLEERREKRRAKYLEEHAEEIEQRKREQEEKERAEREERERIERERLEKELAEKNRKEKSDYVGFIGDKVQLTLTFNYSAHYETKSFAGFGTTIKYIHNFYDDNGNTFTWHTEKSLAKKIGDDEWVYPEQGDSITLKGTINGHSEYKGEKQTVLTRCKIEF